MRARVSVCFITVPVWSIMLQQPPTHILDRVAMATQKEGTFQGHCPSQESK